MGLASRNGSCFKVLATGGVPTCAGGRGDRDPHVLGLTSSLRCFAPSGRAIWCCALTSVPSVFGYPPAGRLIAAPIEIGDGVVRVTMPSGSNLQL